VSAFHHDHLFVPVDRADEAMAVLKEMSTCSPDGAKRNPGNLSP